MINKIGHEALKNISGNWVYMSGGLINLYGEWDEMDGILCSNTFFKYFMKSLV